MASLRSTQLSAVGPVSKIALVVTSLQPIALDAHTSLQCRFFTCTILGVFYRVQMDFGETRPSKTTITAHPVILSAPVAQVPLIFSASPAKTSLSILPLGFLTL